MTSSTDTPHLVLIPAPGWGRLRASLRTGLTFLRLSPRCNLTAVCHPQPYPRMIEELARQTLAPEDRARIRVVPVVEDESAEKDELKPGLRLRGGFEDVMRGLMADAERRGYPRLILFDDVPLAPWTTKEVVNGVADALGLPHIPCWYHCPVPTLPLLRLLGATEHGGRWDGFKERYDAALAEGLSANDAGVKVPPRPPPRPRSAAHVQAQRNAVGKLVEAPDLPPMYDYEYEPQAAAMPLSAAYNYKIPMLLETRKEAVADGLVTYGVPEMEQWAQAQLQKSYEGPIKAIGPQLDYDTFRANHPSVRTTYAPEEKQAVDFLDSMCTAHGPRSTVYVSFGSLVWPKFRPELVEYLVETLLDARPHLPFLFALSSPNAALPERLKDRVGESGRGMLASFAPQLTVLQHDAVRFFISHCGAGSSIETTMAGVPVIAWPFITDQTLWAAQSESPSVTKIWGCGVQLHQVNTGMRGLPLASGGRVTESPDDIKAEMREAIRLLRDDARLEAMKRNLRQVERRMLDSVESGAAGEARAELVRLFLS